MVEIALQRGDRRCAEGNNPLFVSLAHHPKGARTQVQARQGQAYQFSHANRAGVEDLDNGEVSTRDRVPRGGLILQRLKDVLHVVSGEDPRQRSGGSRCSEANPHVTLGVALPSQPRGEPFQRGDFAPE